MYQDSYYAKETLQFHIILLRYGDSDSTELVLWDGNLAVETKALGELTSD